MADISFQLGVMQGRLSKPRPDKIQSHPVETWMDEFVCAKSLGLSFIEWIIDDATVDNALLTDPQSVHQVTSETGVGTPVVCFDYLMDIFPTDGLFWKDPRLDETLLRLVSIARVVGVELVEFPFVDQASASKWLNTSASRDWIRQAAVLLAEYGLLLGLETDLPPHPLLDLVNEVGCDNVVLNFDTGNSSYLRFNPIEEIAILGSLIHNVHIKDRDITGKSVPLGQGLADISLVLEQIALADLNLRYTLQPARGRDDVVAIRTAMDYVINLVKLLD